MSFEGDEYKLANPAENHKLEFYQSRLTREDLKGTSFTPRNVPVGILFLQSAISVKQEERKENKTVTYCSK
jgi:hypothetical protein